MDKSAALFRAANVTIMDYPLEEAVYTALQICDEAVIVMGQSQDDTEQRVWSIFEGYEPGRVVMCKQYFVYDRGWQQRWWNFAVAQTDAEWLLWLDADEAIHEGKVGKIHDLMEKPDCGLIRFPFLHFYATKDYAIRMPLVHNTRMGRRSIGYRMVNWCTDQTPNNAACQVVFGLDGIEANAHSWEGEYIEDVDAPIYHYGWCRDATALAISQVKHRAWYADGGGLERGTIPMVRPHPFDVKGKLSNGRLARWEGSHPAIMDKWFNDHRERWKETQEMVYA